MLIIYYGLGVTKDRTRRVVRQKSQRR